MGDVHAELRSYYEAEATRRLRPRLRGRRIELRDAFMGLLREEGRWSVLDFGAGPGGDGRAFAATGHRFVGLDLAHGNAVLAAEVGVTVVQASIAAPPLRAASFDAGWSMSTLMHAPEDSVVETLGAMTRPLTADAPLQVGLWGGSRQDVVRDSDIEGERRLFSLRPLERNRELLASCGTVEQADTWDVGSDGEEYQTFLVRVR